MQPTLWTCVRPVSVVQREDHQSECLRSEWRMVVFEAHNNGTANALYKLKPCKLTQKRMEIKNNFFKTKIFGSEKLKLICVEQKKYFENVLPYEIIIGSMCVVNAYRVPSLRDRSPLKTERIVLPKVAGFIESMDFSWQCRR